MRELKRSVAKGRLAAMGVGNINRKLHRVKDGVPLWKAVTEGASGNDAERAQLANGRRIKAAKDAKKSVAKRKVRKVTA